MNNVFKHLITSILGIVCLISSLGIAIMSYLLEGDIDVQNSGILSLMGLFLMFAKDDLINKLLSKFISLKK